MFCISIINNYLDAIVKSRRHYLSYTTVYTTAQWVFVQCTEEHVSNGLKNHNTECQKLYCKTVNVYSRLLGIPFGLVHYIAISGDVGQYMIVRYSTVQYSTVQYSTV